MEIFTFAFQCEKRVTANWGRKMSYHILLLQNVGKHWELNTYSFFYRYNYTNFVPTEKWCILLNIYIYIYIYEMLVRIKV